MERVGSGSLSIRLTPFINTGTERLALEVPEIRTRDDRDKLFKTIITDPKAQPMSYFIPENSNKEN